MSREENYKTLSALSAITTLKDEGWVIGGGKTLLDLGEDLNKMMLGMNHEESLGVKAVIAGLQQPYKQITQHMPRDLVNYPQALVSGDVIESTKVLHKMLELVREHVCSILETEKWDVTPKTSSFYQQ